MKTTTKAERISRFFTSMAALGFSTDEAVALRRIEMTLHRWYEQECGDSNEYASWSIERDETTGKPFRVVYPHNGTKTRREPIADREAGAKRRLQSIASRHQHGVMFYIQTDPRGCALYVARRSELNDPMTDSNYSSRGTAVCY